MCDAADLQLAARDVRLALEALRERPPAWWFRDFPDGCCADASAVLAAHLSARGIGQEILDVCGERHVPEYCSHAWLEVDGQIVDITADQFGEGHAAVWLPVDRAWHDAWQLCRRRPAVLWENLRATHAAVEAWITARD